MHLWEEDASLTAPTYFGGYGLGLPVELQLKERYGAIDYENTDSGLDQQSQPGHEGLAPSWRHKDSP